MVISEQHQQALCEICGGWVMLDTMITVTLEDPDGTEVKQQMTEGEARVLLGEMGIQQPPVLCNRHEPLPAWLRADDDPIPAVEELIS